MPHSFKAYKCKYSCLHMFYVSPAKSIEHIQVELE